jgi:hypothetical protein
MDLFYTPEKDTVFEALFGRSLVAWNSAETDVRDLVLYLARDRGKVDGLGPMILVAEMGTRDLSQTIQAYADATLEDETEKKLVHHVSVLFDNLVAYRNHYVHGLFHIHDNMGHISTTTAKSKFKVVHGEVTLKDMGAFIDKVGELTDFVLETMDYLKATDELPEVPELREPIPPIKKQTTLLPFREGRGAATAEAVAAAKPNTE